MRVFVLFLICTSHASFAESGRWGMRHKTNTHNDCYKQQQQQQSPLLT
jgi:hypothetical protein